MIDDPLGPWTSIETDTRCFLQWLSQLRHELHQLVAHFSQWRRAQFTMWHDSTMPRTVCYPNIWNAWMDSGSQGPQEVSRPRSGGPDFHPPIIAGCWQNSASKVWRAHIAPPPPRISIGKCRGIQPEPGRADVLGVATQRSQRSLIVDRWLFFANSILFARCSFTARPSDYFPPPDSQWIVLLM